MSTTSRWLAARSFAAPLLCVLFGLFASTAHANINDNFERANSATLGNGWIEKNANAFSIASGRVTKQAVSNGYADNIVYRPASEDVLDVEASVELRFSASNPGYPQVHTRVQSSTVSYAYWLDSYMLYVNESNSQAILGRQRGSAFVTTLATISISPALNTTDNYRLRLRSTGTAPVELAGYVERWNGSSWQVIGQATFSDSSTDRIVTAGSVGFAGYTETSYSLDNFVRTNLTNVTPNPTPTTSGLAPSSALAGESGLTVTIQGSNFVAGAEARWNGSARPTTFVSSSVLEATISAADLAAAGTASVTVFNPAPGGGLSNAQTFTITPNGTNNPVPAAASLNPASTNAGSAAFNLTVNGSNFATNAVVRWNGSARTTTFISSSQIRAAITASDVTTAGTAQVTVFNPTPGGGTSTSLTFTINAVSNPAPTATSMSPVSVNAGSAAFTLTVTGSNFVPTSVVRWNGSNRTTTYVSPTSLTAAITAADVQSAGSRTVTVFSPTPGGGTSAGLTFTITSAGGGGGPVLNSLSPAFSIVGASSAVVTIEGSGFTPSSVARWNGQNRATSYQSATQLLVTLTSADLNQDRIGTITVVNGSTASGPLSFYVVPGSESVFFDGFNRGPSTSLGNGWIEKTPNMFSIAANGTVSAPDTFPLEYHDVINYRPAPEDLLNVETSIEFVRQAHGLGFAQLHSRIQRNTVQQFRTLESYILYVEDYLPQPTALAFAIQPPAYATGECVLSFVPLPSPLQVGTRYRLRFRVQGTYPVELTGILERFNGSSWELFVSGSMIHDANTEDAGYFCPYSSVPAPISTPGSVGFAKWETASEVYDNFSYRTLSSGAPISNIPAVVSISPAATTAGSAAFNLIVNGANFNSGSTVRWNGSNRTTTFLSSTQLRASIPASDLANAGTAVISVFNSGTNGGASPQTQTFTIVPAGSGGAFTDSFTRADSAVIGNGWIEKNAAAFSLVGGRVAKQASSADYRDTLIYRPASEAALDAEVSTVLRLTSTSVGYPSLFTRLQPSTAGSANVADGYMLYFDDSTTSVVLGRQRGSQFVTTLSSFSLSTPLNTTDMFRMRLRATGTSPVQLQAIVERFVSGAWTIVGQTSTTDSSSERLTTPGVGAVGGWVEATYSFDDFTTSNL